MSNIKKTPLFLTPQATRECLGIGHANNMKRLEIEGKINHNDKRKPNWIEERQARLKAAISYLKKQCILVQTVERQSQIRRYQMTGRKGQFLAEEVVQQAIDLGWVK